MRRRTELIDLFDGLDEALAAGRVSVARTICERLRATVLEYAPVAPPALQERAAVIRYLLRAAGGLGETCRDCRITGAAIRQLAADIEQDRHRP